MKRSILAAVLVILAGQMATAQEAVSKSEANGKIPGTLVAEKGSNDDDLHTDLLQSEPSKGKYNGVSSPSGASAAAVNSELARKSKWTGSIELRNEFVAAAVQGKSANGSTNDTYVVNRLNYDLTGNLRATAGFDIDHNLFGTNKSAEQRTIDTYDDAPFVALMIPKLATLGPDINFSLSGRIYVPTAGQMRDSGAVATRVYGFLTKDIGRFSLAYIANPRPYINSQASYNYVNPDNSTTLVPTNSFRLVQILEIDYKLSDMFTVYQQFGTDDIWTNTAAVNGLPIAASNTQITNEILETAVNYTPNSTYRVTSGISTYEHNYRTAGFTLYGPETRYFISGAASF